LVAAVLLARTTAEPHPKQPAAAVVAAPPAPALTGSTALGATSAPPTSTVRVSPAERAQLLARLEAARHASTAPGVAPSVPAPGAIDKEYIRAQIRSLLPMVKECYDNALGANPSLSGKLLVKFTIVGDASLGGLVGESTIDHESSTIKDPGFEECVTQTMYAAEFPAPEGGGEVHVSYPFIFGTAEE
jgi:hypothetical protein